MENASPLHLQEVVFSTGNRATGKLISDLERAGGLRKIAPRIYTTNLNDNPDVIIKRNLFTILGKLYPGAILSHRSAFEFQPTTSGQIFLTYSYTKKISLGSITLRFLEGYPPIEGDRPFSGELYVSQPERAMLENLQVSRQTGPQSKSLSTRDLEEKLEAIIRTRGEQGLNEFRDRAKSISVQLQMNREFDLLNKLISALLSTHPSRILKSPIAMAQALGNPYDANRIALFEKLFIALNKEEFILIADKNKSINAFRDFAFFEAYFSNYIEGTEFELEDARKIISTDTPMQNRNEDSHDILGTFKIVSNKAEMNLIPRNPEQLIEMLLYRHKVLLSARTSKNPGLFKDKNNRAGETYFVDHGLVKGTLKKGYEYYQALKHPFSRAVYIMFMVSEIHPFLDGNGRIARVMMNAELTTADQAKIIIPTVYRDDYVGALRKLTRQAEPSAYIRMMLRAWKFSSTITGENFDNMRSYLEECNAFKDHDQAKLKFKFP
jgi:Fic family protein